ncbi:PAS domain S-box protein [Methanobacterium alcaliphilum]|uniref:PAS domain S-box protein n=1 Tax=Methanobacterium alcaliphilum TaxID=392018 RepID=UPI002009EDE8|nr:PAS domain S-box protein [Methanobacterium alcaliphilum]MCK9150468.1 PAS domain S-box protein [Methanobacterium alcaliphilum]
MSKLNGKNKIHVLIIADNIEEALLIEEHLSEYDGNFVISRSNTIADSIELLLNIIPDVILLDFSFSDFNGFETLEKIFKTAANIPIIVLTEVYDKKLATAVIQYGTQDYLLKEDLDSKILSKSIFYAIERKNIEKSIKESEERYKTLFNHMSNGVAVYSAVDDGEDFVFKDFNHAAEHIDGVKKTDVIGKRVTEIFPNIKDFGLLDTFKRVYKTGQSEQHPISQYNDNRISVWRENFVYKLPSGEIVAVYDDVTEREKAEVKLKNINKALLKRDAEFQHFIESAPVAIAMFDKKMNYISASKRWIKDYNLPEQKLKGKSHYDVFPEITPEIKKIHKRALAGSIESSDESEFVRSDGTIQYIRWEVHPWHTSTGEIGGIIIFSEDITKRIKSEKALKEREEQLNLFISNAPASIAMFDRKMNYISASKRWIKDYNLEGKEILGKSHYDVFPEITDEWKKIHKQGLKGFSEVAEEDKFVRADGTIQWIKWEVIPWHSAPQEIGGIIIFSEDITKLKLASDALKESQEKYKHVIKTAEEGIVLFDKKGTIIEANPKALELTGSDEDIVGKNIIQLASIIKLSVKEALSAFTNILLNKPIPKEWEYTNKKGEKKFVNIHYSLLKQNEKINAVALVLEDITNLKLREISLKENKQFLENIIENIPDIIFVKTADELKFKRVNKAAEEIWGYKREELLGKTDYDFFTKDEADFYTKKDREVLTRKKLVFIPEETVHTKYSGERILQTKKIPLLDDMGRPNHLLGIAEDITERKLAERELKRSLEEKKSLLKEIHHRVKNNMQIISSLLNLQSNYVKEEESKDILKDSQNRVKSMAMIHEKLYMSSDLSHISFKEYVERLISDLFFTYSLQKSQIKTVLNIEDIEMNMETAIPLGLIINELVTNSLKFAFPEKKGSILIELKVDKEKRKLIIADDGQGLPNQVDFKKTKTLGLVLVNNLVDQIDGNILYDGSHGAKYIITFNDLSYQKRF